MISYNLPVAGQIMMLKERNYFFHIKQLLILLDLNSYLFSLLRVVKTVSQGYLLCQQASLGSRELIAKTTSTRSKIRKQSNTTSKPQNMPRSSIQQPAPSSTMPPTQFGLMGYASIQAHAMAAFQSMPSQTHADTPVITSSGTKISYPSQTPYHIFPPQATNTFMPMLYWPPPNALPPRSYPTTYGYQSFPFPATANSVSIHPQTYNNNHPSCSPFIPKVVEATAKNNNVALEEPDSDSDSSSSSTYPK